MIDRYMRRSTSMERYIIPLGMLSLFSLLITSNAVDTITETKFLADGETIVSSGGIFEMGFFSLGSSKNRYVGIWYKRISNRTVVWVANREIPLSDTSGVLKLTSPGILVLANGTDAIIWSSNTSISAQNPIAQLFDSGNLVVRNANDEMKEENFLWQSFDYPGNNFLPGMKLGKNFLTGQDWYYSSWKSDDDPAQGNYTCRFDTRGYPQVILRQSTTEKYRAGPWNGLSFSGISNPNQIFNFDRGFSFNYALDTEGVYCTYAIPNSSVFSRVVLSQNGVMEQWMLIDQNSGWLIFRTMPIDNCDVYASCGYYGSCNIVTTPICGCLDKFVPKYPKDWELFDWSNGCIRRSPLDCRDGEGDGFVKYSGVKLPDTRISWFATTTTLEECGRMCLRNCSCMAYANLDIREGGSGCLLWYGDLIDIREFSNGDGQDIYVRMASSELGSKGGKGCVSRKEWPMDVDTTQYIEVSACYSDSHSVSKTPGNKRKDSRSKRWKWIILAIAISITLLTIAFFYCTWRRKLQKRGKDLLSFDLGTSIGAANDTLKEDSNSPNSRKKEVDLPRFSFSSASAATDNFANTNKLGEGGFGPVYKGKLLSGYEVAVKRLSRKSGQGLEELQNEAMLIAKLQHKNLVRLLGCCIERDEKILIYKYMPNKSLDFFLFDPIKCGILNWELRVKIIQGIAQGLLYLHEYSRVRIIHRDLKASNILLDKDMNPKISDFGMARIFGGDGLRATNRIVGTYGYMSPEYALEGLFSIKFDVFSFGVLLLEILSGKRNTGFYNTDSLNLLGYAWGLWKSDRGEEVMDPVLDHISSINMSMRYIHIGLLCVQESAADRPTMSNVITMLSNEASLLPSPKQPAFATSRSIVRNQTSRKHTKICSVNDMTISTLEAR